MSIKRRLLFFVPLLVFLLVTSTTFLVPKPAYAVTGSGASVSCGGFSLNPFNLSWIVCPLAEGMKVAVSAMDAFINTQMTVGTPGASSDPNQIFCNRDSNANAKKSCTAYYGAWLSFRNIALGLLVAAGVIVLISQALGFEILDAYTIRKVLPRFLVAALGITLSWQLMQLFVTFSNDLAFGIRFLIYQPFAGIPDLSLDGLSQFTGGTAFLVGLTFLGWMGLLSFLGTALLATLVAFLVLVLRQLVVIMLIIIAPIAIIAYVLPNTMKLYKLWWESFSKALLMFALISGMIATGRVFSAVAGLNSGNTINQFAGFAAYFLPYFLVPLTFKFAGGALRQIGGFVNDRSKGSFDRLRQFRGNQAKKNAKALAEGRRLSGTGYGGPLGAYSAFARRFNRATEGTANLANAGYNPRRMRQRMSAARSNRLIEEGLEAREKNQAVKALVADDDLVESALWASDQIRQGSTRGFDSLVREELSRRNYHNVEQGTALVHNARNSINNDAFDTAMAISAFGTSSGLTPNYTTDPVTGETIITGGAAEGRDMINRVAGGDRQRAIQMLGAARQLAESKGRFDLAGGSFTEDAEILDDMYRGNLNQRAANQRLLRGALDGTSRGRIFGGHRRNIDAMAPQVRQLLDESFGLGNRPVGGGRAVGPGGSGNPQEVVQQLAFAANALDAASSNSAESARVVNDQVLSQEVNLAALHPDVLHALGTITYARNPDGTVMRSTVTGEPAFRDDLGVTTYGALVEAMRSDENFGRYRREYGRYSQEAAVAGTAAPPPPAPGAGAATPPTPSDKRLKRNVVYLTTICDIDLYKFQYIWSDQVYVGVMAQDLLLTHPEVVTLYSDGYYRVNYAMLGLKMRTLEEFQEKSTCVTTV